MSELAAGKGLEGGEMIGVNFEGGGVGFEGVVNMTGLLEGLGQIEAGIGVAGHEFGGPLKLLGGFV